MEEFLKIDWKVKDVSSELENIITFMTEECIADSYVYTSSANALINENDKCAKQTKKEYIPGLSFHKQFDRFSTVDKWQQAHCVNALKCLQSGKNRDKFNRTQQFSIGIYKQLQQKIASENIEYLQSAKDKWQASSNQLTQVKSSLLNYAKNHWKASLHRCLDYGHTFSPVNLLPLNCDEDELGVTVGLEQNVLETGSMAKCAIPTLKCRFVLKLSTLPAHDKEIIASKLTVSKDSNVDQLLKNHAVDVVISSSGLKRIMTGSNDNEEWVIPVVIKQKIRPEGTTNIVFVDKTLPKRQPTRIDFNRKCVKLMIKTNFCKYKGFSFETAAADSSNQESETVKSAKNTIHHNASYKIWKLDQQEENKLMKSTTANKELRVLVRCKTDASEALENGPLQPVIVLPKLEYQLGFGGNAATKTELSREWTSLFFRPYSKLYRVRTAFTTLEVVMVEGCTMQKINTEAMTQYQYKPHLGLGVMYKIFSELSKLQPGNYLLRHIPKHGPFVAILKESSETSSDCYNLQEEYKNCEYSNEVNMNWCPIDTNLMLPVHTVTNQMPGLFPGKERAKNCKKGAKKKKKKKTKGKINKTI